MYMCFGVALKELPIIFALLTEGTFPRRKVLELERKWLSFNC